MGERQVVRFAPARPAELAGVEERLGGPLPDVLRAALWRHDGLMVLERGDIRLHLPGLERARFDGGDAPGRGAPAGGAPADGGGALGRAVAELRQLEVKGEPPSGSPLVDVTLAYRWWVLENADRRWPRRWGRYASGFPRRHVCVAHDPWEHRSYWMKLDLVKSRVYSVQSPRYSLEADIGKCLRKLRCSFERFLDGAVGGKPPFEGAPLLGHRPPDDGGP